MQAESFLALTVSAPAAGQAAAAASVVLVLSTGQGSKLSYFVVRGGKKEGPFGSLDKAMAGAYGSRKLPPNRTGDCAAFEPDPAPDDAQPNSSENGQGQSLVFKGKSFGPYAMIINSTVTPDGGRAYYSASDKDKSWFGCTDGRRVSFSGVPNDFKFSPSGMNAAILCQGTLSLTEMENIGSLPPDKLEKAMKDMDKKFLVTIDGKKFGPFASLDDYWFPASSNDLYFRADDQVFRNGTPFLKTGSFDRCGFYPSPDGKAFALFDYENIRFSDGKSFASPLDVKVSQRGGKTVFSWLSLEKNKDLVLYERVM